MIKVEFLQDFRGFKKGSVYEFETDKSIIIVGDNGSGKSTLVNLIYCYFLRTVLDKLGDEKYNLPTIHYKMIFGSPKSHARYIYHNVLDIVKVEFPENCKMFKYSTEDYNVLDYTGDDPRIPVEVIAKQVYMYSMSRGEVEFENLTDFIQEYQDIKDPKYDNWVIFDEPDNSLSIRHSMIFPHYFNFKKPGKILILHHPYTIENAEKVYYLKKEYDNNGESNGIKMIVCSGKEFIEDIIATSKPIIENLSKRK